MRVIPFAVASAALAVSFAASGRAQDATFRSTLQTVAVYATATDSSGRLVPNLEQSHFEILDNGVNRPITTFKSDVQPITVVIMLDTSGSMTFNLEFLKDAAEQFILRLLPEDRARLGSFSDKIRISPRLTNDRDELVRILRNDIQFGNPTYLWDAIDASMSALAGEGGRRVVLIFTDGEDDKSVQFKFDDVLARAVNEEFMIYSIGLQSQILGRTTRPDRNLRRLSEQTGGGYFELTRTADLNATFTRVADELHRQYVLGFNIERLDGTTHRLDVRAKVPGVVVRARKSYVAAPAGTPPAPSRNGSPR